MSPSRRPAQDKGRHTTRFPRIVADARDLGVSRIHLYLVLTGGRISHRLLADYRRLKHNQQQEAAR